MLKLFSLAVASAEIFTDTLTITEVVPNSFVTFYTEGCCDDLLPMFVEASKEYVGPVKFGLVESANKVLMEKYQIQEYPTILFFDAFSTPTVYDGVFDTQAFVDFANTIII